jgi:dTDP-4-dehydrorhamnose 3,5-epimerase
MSANPVMTEASQRVVPVAERGGVQLAIKSRKVRSLGKVISDPKSPDLIHGVEIEPLQVHPDDRGFFMEVARLGSPGIAEHMTPGDERRVQVSTTVTYPNTIKAIHYHFEQTDVWVPVKGMLQVFLYDLRAKSETWGETNTIYVGTLRPWSILIPPGVGHGYKALGIEPIQLVYLTDRFYNSSDEGRLHYADADVAYDWETQHK